MRFIKLILNALTFGLLDLLLDVVNMITKVNFCNNVNLVKMVDPTDYNTVGISLEIEECFQLRFKFIISCVEAIGFELFTDHFFNEQVFRKELFDKRKSIVVKIEKDDCYWEFLLPTPVERFTQISPVSFYVAGPAKVLLQLLFEGIIIILFEKFRD